MKYKWQHVKPDEFGVIEVEGRIVDVKRISNDPKRGAHVLVEATEGRDIPANFADNSKGVGDIPQRLPSTVRERRQTTSHVPVK